MVKLKIMKNLFQKIQIFFLTTLFLIFSPLEKIYALSCPSLKFLLVSDGANRTLGDVRCLVLRSIEILLIFAGVYAVVRIVLAGIQYSSAIGNPEKQTEAKKALIWSVIGFVVAMCAYAIMLFIQVNIAPTL